MAETWTIKELLDWTTRYFAGKGIEAARLEAELLLAHAVQKDRVYLYAAFDAPCSAEERASYRELINRRVQGEPLAYITGAKEFMSLSFEVDSNVLIPRPDSETLVEAALRIGTDIEKPIICDIGCGSGAIAISLAYYLPRAEVWAIDISRAALELTRRNAARHKVEIHLHHSDLLSNMPADLQFDIIAANLPYINDAAYAALESSVRDFEPELALKGGADGLQLYRRLLPETVCMLKPGGFLLMEMDSEQAEMLCSIVETSGAYDQPEIIKDLSGRSRVVKSRRNYR